MSRQDIYNKSNGKVRILNAVGQDYNDIISLLIMQAMELTSNENEIKTFVKQQVDELNKLNILNTKEHGEFLARVSSINSVKELSALNVECNWVANNAPAYNVGSNRMYVAEGDNLVILNRNEENDSLLKKFIEFLVTNSSNYIEYVKKGEFFLSFKSSYKNNKIEDHIKNFKEKSPLIVMSNVSERAPGIKNYSLYRKVQKDLLGK